jgi:hypothetical protein
MKDLHLVSHYPWALRSLKLPSLIPGQRGDISPAGRGDGSVRGASYRGRRVESNLDRGVMEREGWEQKG